MKIQKLLSSFVVLVLLLLPVLSGCGGGAKSALQIAPPAIPPVVSITVSPSAVLPGQNATLSWSSTNADTCTASGSWSGTQLSSGSSNITLQGTATQTYTLECTSAGGVAEQTVTLALSPADGACSTAKAAAHRFPTSRAIAAARRAVAEGRAGRTNAIAQ